MNEEYINKLNEKHSELVHKRQEIESIIDLLKSSNEIVASSKMQVIPYLEGYSEGLKNTLEWLNRIIP